MDWIYITNLFTFRFSLHHEFAYISNMFTFCTFLHFQFFTVRFGLCNEYVYFVLVYLLICYTYFVYIRTLFLFLFSPWKSFWTIKSILDSFLKCSNFCRLSSWPLQITSRRRGLLRLHWPHVHWRILRKLHLCGLLSQRGHVFPHLRSQYSAFITKM